MSKRGVLRLGRRDLAGLVRAAVLDQKRSFRLRVKGSSMHPFLKDGDTVTVSPCPSCSARKGEVVAFIHPRVRRLMIHRIVETREGRYLTKGDNTPDEDGFIGEEDIIGRVTRIERRTIVFSLLLQASFLKRWLQRILLT